MCPLILLLFFFFLRLSSCCPPVPKPAGLSHEEACAVIWSGIQGFTALHYQIRVRPGDRILICTGNLVRVRRASLGRAAPSQQRCVVVKAAPVRSVSDRGLSFWLLGLMCVCSVTIWSFPRWPACSVRRRSSRPIRLRRTRSTRRRPASRLRTRSPVPQPHPQRRRAPAHQPRPPHRPPRRAP